MINRLIIIIDIKNIDVNFSLTKKISNCIKYLDDDI